LQPKKRQSPPRSSPPTVTGLREVRRSQVAVELDGESWRVLPLQAVADAGLRVGCALDRERTRALARGRRRATALAVAGSALRRRALSEQELDARLERRGVAAGDRDEARRVLTGAGYLDDARFARSRASALAERGSGDALIRHDLEQRGIAPELADEALAALLPESERLHTELQRRGTDPAALRRLAARGFPPELLEDLAAASVARPDDDVVG
jgi:SOS response regulatory protein OraA/RecX